MQTPTTIQSGMFDTVKEALRPSNIAQTIRTHKEMLIEIALYAGVGFLVGFLLKRYSTIVSALMLCIVALVVLQQMGMINLTIYWDRFYEMVGMQPIVTSDDSTMAMCTQWAKLNMRVLVSFGAGAVIGFKVG